MELKYMLLIGYAIPSVLNSYCYLFQRTARKVRQYAIGTTGVGQESNLFPDWYHMLALISYIRYLPLAWLLYLDWELALGVYFGFGFINLVWPTNDYGSIQMIKRYFEKKRKNGTFDKKDDEYLSWVLMAEGQTLKPETEETTKFEKYRLLVWISLGIIGIAAYNFGGYIYNVVFK